MSWPERIRYENVKSERKGISKMMFFFKNGQEKTP